MREEDALRNIRNIAAWTAGIAALALVVGLIVVPPFVGMADSGDFGRVLSTSGLKVLHPASSYEELYFNYAQRQFGYGGYALGGYVSTHVALVAIAGWIGRAIDGEIFDVRILGALYTAMFAFAVALLVKHAPSPNGRQPALIATALLAAALLFVFGDIGYVAYFHSFFGEPYALVAMLFALAAALAIASASRPSALMLALFVAAAAAVATSKIQNAPLGFAFALLAWRMARLRDDRKWRRQAWTGAVVLLVVSSLMIVAAPNRLKHANLYQSVFYGVLKDSPDVSRDMKELGIPAKYAVLAGTNYFQKNTAIPQNDPILRREVLDKLGHKDIALYYLRHPSRFAQKIERAAANAAYIRPAYLGNYEATAGKPPGALSHAFSAWSGFKAAHMPRNAGFYLAFFAAYGLGLACLWLRAATRGRRLAAETLAVVALTGVFSFVIPLIGDGEADLGKHLFMFNVCFDMMVISVFAGTVYGVVRLGERIGETANRKATWG
ncbi:hypothetical protein ACF3MZ_25160 [Paenibacillaceae bacterium WGS1546]|uniref:glycan biosynthesis hexose transferase WsfD n=1 Tax=Cohnella sp. WGS1546 TaxID=3366810 RepID=UPI00372D310F